MMVEPIVRLTGAPRPDTRRADSIFNSSAIQRHIAGREGKRYAPNFQAPRVYTGRNYNPQTRPLHQGETAQQMPNYNQLTNFERKLYEVLPGFSESTVGKAVQRFSESWAGKALGYIDVLAEGVERVGGLASQFSRASGNPAEMAELQANLNAAWYAGSLAGDMMNLPTTTYDADRNVTGMSIPDALPGAAGIADARNQISDLMEQGFTASEALQQVKAGYYESLGALQIRAQLNDLYVHVLGDPINYVFPFIKPVERIKALSYFASSTKWSDEVIDVASAATKALRADDLSDIQKLTALDEVKQWAKLSGKFIGNKGDEFNKAVEANDLGKVADMMDKVIKDVGLNVQQRIAINITGGKDPFKVPTTTWEKFYDKMPWRLTPTARAYEYVTTIQDNVGMHIINAMDNEDDIVNALIRAASGATGEELGHAFLTIEGRAVQASLKGFEQEAIALLNQVKAIGPEKELLADLAQLVGKSEEELMGIMKGGDFASVAKMTENAMSPNQLETIFSKLDNMPYTTRLFKYKLMNKLADRSAQAGVLMFGVKQRGLVQKLAQAVKSAETLAFLRINPGYMVRNVLNNEVTMIARGAGLGWKDLQEAGKYFDLDFEPFRMSQGFGAIGETFAHPADTASEVLGEVLTGEVGKLDSFSRRVNDIPLGKFDMGSLSSKMERNASRRAFTTSYIRGWNQYFWKPGVGFDELGTYLPTRVADQIKAVDEGLIPAIERFVASARTPQELRSKAFTENFNLSINNIVDEASATIGYDITKSVPPEIIASIRDGLEEAAKKGRIPTFMDDLRTKLAAQLDEVTPQIVNKVRDDVASQVVAEGPQSFPKILSDAMDETYNLGIYHARRDAELAEIARSVAPDNPELAHQLWKQMAKEADDYYKRDWQRLEATIQGFKKAAGKDKNLARIADEAVENFRNYKNGWQKFWKSKRTRGDAYWDAIQKGKKPSATWEDIANQTSKEYNEMIAIEDTLQREMDNIVARTITDDVQRKNYLAGQADLRDYIRRDKEQVSELFDKMKNATADEREALYQELVTERIPRLDAIREKQFVVTKALEGDPESIQKLEQVADALPKREVSLKPDIDYQRVAASELPPDVGEALVTEAQMLKNSLSGQGVELIPDEAGTAFVRGSTNPAWYIELYKQGYSRKQIERALDRIIEGKDVARANEKALPALKDLIMERLISGDEMPPHPATLMFFNMEDEAAQALGQYIADPNWARTATDEDWLKLVGGQENMDNLLARLDDIEAGRPPKPSSLPEEAVGAIPTLEDIAPRYPNWQDEIGGMRLREGDVPNLDSISASLDDWEELPGIRKVKMSEFEGVTGKTYSVEQNKAIGKLADEIKESGEITPLIVVIDDEGAYILEGSTRIDALKRLDVEEFPAVVVIDKTAAEAAPAVSKTYVGDYKHLKKGVDTWDPPEQLATDEWWLTRGFPALDEIEKSAMAQAAKPELRWANMPDEAKKYLNNYIEHVSGQMGDARYASTRFAEFGRDAALLNYNRRYNFNTWLGTIMPYEFWTTHSMMKWALHSIDRPAMLTSYLRIQEFMNTAGAPGQALPQRLKGQFRIPMPFLPDWAGDSIFFDPLRSMIPIQNFTYGYEEEMQRKTQLEGKTEYILNDMVENKEIRPEEAEIAIMDKSGDLWDKAQQMAIDDNEELAFNAWDFASLLSSPHAPLDWAAKTLQGRKEDIGPFMPASRTIKGVAGLMGVDWTRSPYNMEARVRTQLGLPAFDKWDDYRVDRMLSNMTALGEITSQEALRAMIDREGPIYEEAIKKSNFEFGIGAVGSTVGIPSKAYPEGEFLQRSLDDDFQKAIEMRDKEGGADALTNFFELHPEYETRLALHKPPEERLRQFLIDDLWNIYLDFPKLTKNELKDQLGDEFYTKFLNKDTRSYDSIELGELQIWLKLMGGDPPGTLESEPAPIDLADPEVAWRAQVFYDTRTTYFPDFYEIQNGYYDIPEENKAERKAYKAANPSLEPYWEWRRDWMHRNPEVVPYLSDKFEFKYSSPQAERRAEQPQPWLTWDEWTQYMGPNMANLMEDHFVRDYAIPNTFQDKAEELGQQLGISYEELLSLMEESLIAR